MFSPSSYNLKDITFIFYLFAVFPIVFPTILGFLFIRQANIKSYELNTINSKFITIHEVNQSLSALLEVNKGKSIGNKTEQIINKLIDNTLNFNKNSKIHSFDNINFENMNSQLDSGIDTVEKKKSLLNWSI
jgi:hypothetical protein